MTSLHVMVISLFIPFKVVYYSWTVGVCTYLSLKCQGVAQFSSALRA